LAIAGSLSGNFTRWLPLGDDLAHQRRVVGRDVVADELAMFVKPMTLL
jgi:hypothetical protein